LIPPFYSISSGDLHSDFFKRSFRSEGNQPISEGLMKVSAWQIEQARIIVLRVKYIAFFMSILET